MSIFLEVISDDISVLVDNKHQHFFKPGDIIEGFQDGYIKVNGFLLCVSNTLLTINDFGALSTNYYINHVKNKSGVMIADKKYMWELLKLGYVIDITKKMRRDLKLKELGI